MLAPAPTIALQAPSLGWTFAASKYRDPWRFTRGAHAWRLDIEISLKAPLDRAIRAGQFNPARFATLSSHFGKIHLRHSAVREIRSCAELQTVCLQALKQCRGFEQVHEVLVQPRATPDGFANWTLAAVRPRVANEVLREARGVIALLQQTYELSAAEPPGSKARPRR